MIEPTERVDLRRHLWPLVHRRALVLTFVVSATVSSLLLTYLASEKYEAATTVLYQPREEVSLQPKTRDALGFPMPLVPLESITNTLEEMVKSDALLERAVSELHLDQKQQPPPGWIAASYREVKDHIKEWSANLWQVLKYGRLLSKDPFAAAVTQLRENLSVKRTNKTYTFELHVQHENPRRAAEIVNTVARLLSDFLVGEQVRVARDAQAKIEPPLSQSTQEVAQLRASVESFKAETGVSSLSEEVSLKLKTISGLDEDLAGTFSTRRSLEKKSDELAGQLRQLQPSIKYDSTTTDNPVVNDMRLELARLEVQRAGLLEKFTPNHPEVMAVDAQIAQARDKLRREQPTVVSSESMRVNDVYEKVLSEKLSTDAEIQSLVRKEQTLRRQIADETGAARALTEKEPRLSELSMQLQAAEKSYDEINQALEEARLAEARAANELVVLHEAMVPNAPARPIKILHVGTTLLLSVLLAIGFVYLYDYLDGTVHDSDQLEFLLERPVFATIPVVPEGRARELVRALLRDASG